MQARVIPYLSYRSQGFNAARELVGWQNQINLGCMDDFYGSFSVTPEYSQSFWASSIAEPLFCDALIDSCYQNKTGKNCCCPCPTIKIQGTKVANRNSKAWLAEYFYLPTDYDSEVTFKPEIQNVIVDINFYMGLDPWLHGLFFRIHAPVTYTKWNLHLCEKIISAGKNPWDIGYFTDTFTPEDLTTDDAGTHALERSKMVPSFQAFMNGATISGVPGITFNPLNRARMSSCGVHKTSVAEVTAALGWNFLACENYHLGLEVRAAAPTGTRPAGCYLFEPVVGNGHHWELGVGLTSHWNMFCNCDQTASFGIYIDGNIQHLFKARQCRTFDLCNKPLSRYMLATQFTKNVQRLIAGGQFGCNPPSDAKIPDSQFAKVYMPLANITTIPVDVSADVQGELVIKFATTWCNWQWDLGYDFWGRSCEKICPRFDCCKDTGLASNLYALKGNAYMFGMSYNCDTNQLQQQQGLALSATESNATIFNGTNEWPCLVYSNPGFVPGCCSNSEVDNAVLAWDPSITHGPLITRSYPECANANGAQWLQVHTSLEPVLLNNNNLDINGARTASITNSLFTHISYTWNDCDCYIPYLGVGGQVEFGSHDKQCCGVAKCVATTTNKTCTQNWVTKICNTQLCCANYSLSQWGVWLKGGFSF